jgi:hypothetical protein
VCGKTLFCFPFDGPWYINSLLIYYMAGFIQIIIKLSYFPP